MWQQLYVAETLCGSNFVWQQICVAATLCSSNFTGYQNQIVQVKRVLSRASLFLGLTLFFCEFLVYYVVLWQVKMLN